MRQKRINSHGPCFLYLPVAQGDALAKRYGLYGSYPAQQHALIKTTNNMQQWFIRIAFFCSVKA
jgi:hypothetical protein